MICMFTERDPKAVLKHLNDLGDSVEVINVFAVGLKTTVFYKKLVEVLPVSGKDEERMKTQKPKG